jgi:AcrR family transcriptional regulator
MKQLVKRREPSQGRAQKTKLLIFEAASRLLEQEGLESFNTNRLAELSGFSVGTIYQYFADKRAILLALAQHEQERAMAEVRRLLMIDLANLPVADENSPSPRARPIVRAILQTFGGRQRANRILIDLALQSGEQRHLDSPMTALTSLLTSGAVVGRHGNVTLTETDAFVLTQAVIGPIRAALMRNMRLFRKPQFEDALVDLIDAFVKRRLVEQKPGA